MSRTAPALVALCLALSSCGGEPDNGTAIGGVSQSEADALNDAAEMLDEEQANASAPPPAN